MELFDPVIKTDPESYLSLASLKNGYPYKSG